MDEIMFLVVLLFLLAVTIVFAGYSIFKYAAAKRKKRRRWARIRVPNEKMITCKIAEPKEFAGDSEFLVNDINVGGLAFFANKIIADSYLKLLIRFPFTSFHEASTVWGKVVYCNKIGDSQKYRVGICYVRPNKRST